MLPITSFIAYCTKYLKTLCFQVLNYYTNLKHWIFKLNQYYYHTFPILKALNFCLLENNNKVVNAYNIKPMYC